MVNNREKGKSFCGAFSKYFKEVKMFLSLKKSMVQLKGYELNRVAEKTVL